MLPEYDDSKVIHGWPCFWCTSVARILQTGDTGAADEYVRLNDLEDHRENVLKKYRFPVLEGK